MCEVSPEHVGLLRTFGTICLVAGIISILTGVTYFRAVIRRDEEPFSYWSGTIGLLFLGGATLLGTWVCV